jgi:hypothetical protein
MDLLQRLGKRQCAEQQKERGGVKPFHDGESKTNAMV